MWQKFENPTQYVRIIDNNRYKVMRGIDGWNTYIYDSEYRIWRKIKHDVSLKYAKEYAVKHNKENAYYVGVQV